MALTKEQKQKIIEELEEKIARKKAIIFVDFTGLKIKELSDLRRKLKSTGNELKVAKKTLMGIAFKKAGLKVESRKLKGEVALVFGFKDEISPAKIVWQHSENNPNLKILGGIIESKGYEFLKTEEIIELAKLPTKEELLQRLIGSLASPISGLINVLQGNMRSFLYIISQIKRSES